MSEKDEMRKLIAEYAATYGVQNTRDIVAYISDTIGRTPSTATVAKVLKELGYEPTKPSFWVKGDE
jgi:hypothetical protein